MRSTLFPLLFLALALLLPARACGGDKGKNKFKLENGFELLFNSKDLTGWKEFSGKKELLKGKAEAYKGRFKVSDGKLVLDPSVKGDLHVETQRKFGKEDHIKFDFKPGPKCNNDLFIYGTKFDLIPGNEENKDVKEGQWHTFEIKIVDADKFVFVRHVIDGVTVRSTKFGGGPGDKDEDPSATPLRIRAEFGSIEIKNVRARKKD
jgi:hypothetical protein